MADRVQYDIVINDVASAKLREIGAVGRKSLGSILPHAVRVNKEIREISYHANKAAAGLSVLTGASRRFRKESGFSHATKDLHHYSRELDRVSKKTSVFSRKKRGYSAMSAPIGNYAVYANALGAGRLAGTLGRGQSIFVAGSRLGAMGGGASLALPALAAGAFSGYGVARGAGLQERISMIDAISDQTAQNRNNLLQKAIQSSQQVTATPTQVAEVMEELVRSGMTSGEAQDSAETVLKAAQANKVDAGRIADLSTNIMAGFGLPLSELEPTLDAIGTAANKSTAGIESLSEALKYAAPTAKLANIGLSDTAAATAILADSGLKGGIGGRGLRMLFRDLLNDSSRLRIQLQKLGIDEALNKGLPGFLKQLEEQDITAEQLLPFTSANSGTALSVLMGAGSGRMTDFSKMLAGSGGFTARTAKLQIDNLAGATKILRGNLEALATTTSRPLLSPLQEQAEAINKSLNNQQLVAGLTEVSSHFADIVDHVGELPGKLGALNTVISGLNETLQIVNSVTGSISKAVNFIYENNFLRKLLGGTDMDVPDFFSPSWIFEKIEDAIPETEKKRRAISEELEEVRKNQPGFIAALGKNPSYLDPTKDTLTRAITAATAPLQRTTDPTVNDDVKADKSMVRGGVTIQIENLIRDQNITTNNFREAPGEIRDNVTEALIEALREAEAYE